MLKKALKEVLKKAGYRLVRDSEWNKREDRGVPPSTRYLRTHNPTPLKPEHLTGCQVLPDRVDILKRLGPQKKVLEVGVAYGDFSEEILRHLQPEQFFALDTYEFSATNELWGRKDIQEFGGTHLEFIRDRFSNEVKEGRLITMEGLSSDLLPTLPSGEFDYIYIDANHDYQFVLDDITQSQRLLAPSGVIQLNDYVLWDPVGHTPFGVARAVNDFLLQSDFKMTHLSLNDGIYFDAAISRSSDSSPKR